MSVRVRQAAQQRTGLSIIEHRTLPKTWVGTFLVRGVQSRDDIELILTAKMETRHPVEDYFGSEFRTICVITAESWRPKVARPGNLLMNFYAFWGKTTPYGKSFKLCSESFHHDTDRRCCVQISWYLADGKSAKSREVYQTKNIKPRTRLKVDSSQLIKVSANFEVTWHKSRPNIKNSAPSNWDILLV